MIEKINEYRKMTNEELDAELKKGLKEVADLLDEAYKHDPGCQGIEMSAQSRNEDELLRLAKEEGLL